MNRTIRLIFIFLAVSVIYFLIPLYPSPKESTTISTSTIFTTTTTTSSSLNLTESKQNIIHVAVVVSLAKQTSHIAEFHLLYNSWHFLQNFPPLSEQVILDLIVFCEQPSCSQLPAPCLPLSFNHPNRSRITPRCFYEELSVQIVQQWQDYLYMTSIAFLLTPEYRRVIFQYQWILRVDQDAILSPGLLFGLLGKHSIKLYDMQFGATGHGIQFTFERIRSIAKKLGYKHMGIHDLCSTWLVHPNDSIQIANLTTIIGRHFLKNEYGPHVPGIENLPAIGEWPKWWRGVTSLYAASIAINHIFSSSIARHHQSPALDHPSASGDSVWKAWHIHSLHNDEPFAKFRHRGNLREFTEIDPPKRIERMANITYTQNILNGIIKEFYQKYNTNNDKFIGNISVRNYVTALAWQKAHAAVGALNLGY
ncbi:hypothetical protein I4U23_023177 [Adineta vaga]|nr:hypothetical protein I4U23_023177 [Adineta vaga]